jgi:hypothetical protein
MYPFYLGIDLYLKRTYVVLMETEGEVIDERSNHGMVPAIVQITIIPYGLMEIAHKS